MGPRKANRKKFNRRKRRGEHLKYLSKAEPSSQRDCNQEGYSFNIRCEHSYAQTTDAKSQLYENGLRDIGDEGQIQRRGFNTDADRPPCSSPNYSNIFREDIHLTQDISDGDQPHSFHRIWSTSQTQLRQGFMEVFVPMQFEVDKDSLIKGSSSFQDDLEIIIDQGDEQVCDDPLGSDHSRSPTAVNQELNTGANSTRMQILKPLLSDDIGYPPISSGGVL